jgi:hypothetical protein
MYKNCLISILCISLNSLFQLGCNNRPFEAKKKKVGSYIIEAQFHNDSVIDGQAKTYDRLNNLIEVSFYKNGVKDGLDIEYDVSGRIKDSTYYTNGILNGPSYIFDSTGKILFGKYNYYGLPVGHYYSYSFGKLKRYFYYNFERNNLVLCEYDSLNRPRLFKFISEPVLTEAQNSDGRQQLNLFLYLPSPPGMKTIYKIGLENERHETRDEIAINHNRLFLDTLLPYPATGWHYFVFTQIESRKDSINRIYFQELRTGIK